MCRKIRRPKQYEFLTSTKKQRFAEVGGLCEKCQSLIGDLDEWSKAVYHHNKFLGDPPEPPTRDIKFCVVLCHNCHWSPESFKQLHGVSLDKVWATYGRGQVIRDFIPVDHQHPLKPGDVRCLGATNQHHQPSRRMLNEDLLRVYIPGKVGARAIAKMFGISTRAVKERIHKLQTTQNLVL